MSRQAHLFLVNADDPDHAPMLLEEQLACGLLRLRHDVYVASANAISWPGNQVGPIVNTLKVSMTTRGTTGNLTAWSANETRRLNTFSAIHLRHAGINATHTFASAIEFLDSVKTLLPVFNEPIALNTFAARQQRGDYPTRKAPYLISSDVDEVLAYMAQIPKQRPDAFLMRALAAPAAACAVLFKYCRGSRQERLRQKILRQTNDGERAVVVQQTARRSDQSTRVGRFCHVLQGEPSVWWKTQLRPEDWSCTDGTFFGWLVSNRETLEVTGYLPTPQEVIVAKRCGQDLKNSGVNAATLRFEGIRIVEIEAERPLCFAENGPGLRSLGNEVAACYASLCSRPTLRTALNAKSLDR